MLNTFQIKLATLGCLLSTCLVGTVQANEELSGEPDFTIIPPYVGNIACGAGGRNGTYKVINNTGRYDIRLLSADIIINKGDSFPNNDNLAKVVGGSCFEEFMGDQCDVIVEHSGQTLTCPLTEPSHIDRSLRLHVNTAMVYAYSPIFQQITDLGAAENFALLAPNIGNSSGNNANVYRNDVANTSMYGYRTNKITYHDGATFFGPGAEITQAAVQDTKAAYRTFLNLQHNFECEEQWPDIPHNHTFGEGNYCFKGAAPVVQHGTMNLTGTPDSRFVFIMDYEGALPFSTIFWALDHARTNLISSTGPNGEPPSADNVFFIINGAAEIDNSEYLVGNFLTTGGVRFRGTTPLTGRVLIAGEYHSVLSLNGNAIYAPEHHHSD